MTMTLNGSGTIVGLVAGGLPDDTITQADLAASVAGNGPAFSAYRNSAQTITPATATKINFEIKEFDTNSNYDSTTNYRFTPTVAGYYQINAQLAISGTTITRELVYLYQNGANFKVGTDIQGNGGQQNGVLSTLVYANGATDYFEIYTYVTGTGTISIAGGSNTKSYFQAAMVRSAT